MVKFPKIGIPRKKKSLDLGGLDIDPNSVPAGEIDFSDLTSKAEPSQPERSIIFVKDLTRANIDIFTANVKANNILIIKFNIDELNIRPELKQILEELKARISAVSGKIYQLSEDILLILPKGVKLVKFESTLEEK